MGSKDCAVISGGGGGPNETSAKKAGASVSAIPSKYVLCWYSMNTVCVPTGTEEKSPPCKIYRAYAG